MKITISLRLARFDLDIDRDGLTDARHIFGRLSKHQIKFAAVQRISRDRPARVIRFIGRRNKFHVQRDGLCHAVHRQIAENVSGLRSGLFHTPALESDLGIFFDRKKFRASQMIVAFGDPGVDAANVDPRRDRRIFRMFAVDVDLAVELFELSMCGSKKLMDGKSNRRT